jgi:hypothetical protein
LAAVDAVAPTSKADRRPDKRHLRPGMGRPFRHSDIHATPATRPDTSRKSNKQKYLRNDLFGFAVSRPGRRIAIPGALFW